LFFILCFGCKVGAAIFLTIITFLGVDFYKTALFSFDELVLQ
jgi:DMSO reductase anchor subunit